MILRRVSIAVLAVACTALSACSSSDDSAKSDPPTGSSSPSTSSQSTSSPSSPSPSSTGSSSGTDAGLAAIVVQPGDLPSTFRAEAADQDNDRDTEVLTCVGAKSTQADEKSTVHSQDYSTETASISAQATRFGSQASVDADAAIFRSPKIQSCFTTLLRQKAGGVAPGAKVTTADVEVTPGANGGPSNVVATVKAVIVIQANGKEVPVYITSVFITGPKVEAELDLTGIGSEVDSALATTVTAAVAKRAAAA